jgi:hypothetical protein
MLSRSRGDEINGLTAMNGDPTFEFGHDDAKEVNRDLTGVLSVSDDAARTAITVSGIRVSLNSVL